MSSNLVKTSSEWNSSSLKAYIPPRGVLCVEISNEVSNDDQNINHNISIKVGDGERAYPALPYLSFKDEYIEDIRIRLIKMINEQSDKIVDAYTKDEIDSLLKEIDDKINGIDTTVDLSEYVKKTDIPEIPETHTHDNKSILDQIECVFTPQEKEKLANLNINDQGQTVNDHTHSNKSILDKIEVAMTKDDREKLNQLTKGRNYDTEISELKSNTHSHAHLDILEGTTASFTTEYEEIIKNWKPSESATYESFKGATDSDDGETGLVPAPSKGDQDKFLRGDGTWVTVEVSGSGESFTLVAGDNVTIVDDDENKTKTISVTIPSVDLSGYATTSYVDNKVSNIVIPTYDLSGYATQTWVTTQINNIDIPSLDGYATEQYVGDAIDSIPTYTLPTASTSSLGGVIVGSGLTVTGEGILDVIEPELQEYREGDGISFELTSSEYQQVKYIMSTGNQYIPTNIKSDGSYIKIKISYHIDELSDWGYLFHASDSRYYGSSPASTCYGTVYYYGDNKYISPFRCNNNSRVYYDNLLPLSNSRDINTYTFEFMGDGTINITGNDGDKTVKPTSNGSGAYPIWLFGFENGAMVKMKLYGFKAYDINGILITDLIPVKRTSDNKAGLYDTVNSVFYTYENRANTSDQMTVGPDVRDNHVLWINNDGVLDISNNANDPYKLDVEFRDQTKQITIPQYVLPAATDQILGGVIIGDGIDVDENGVISAVSNSNYDSGWINVTIDDGDILSQDIQYRKIATGLIELCGTFTPSQQFQSMTLFTLPEEYRPHKKRVFIQLHPNILTPFLLTVDMDGVVKIDSPSSITFDEDQEYYIEAMYLAGSVTI